MKTIHPFWYHLTAFVTVAIWGSTFVSTKLLLLGGLSAEQIFTLRFIIAYVLMLAFSLSRGHHRWLARTWKDELLMVCLGISGGSLYFLTENNALNYTTTTNVSLIVCICPLFAAMLIALFYHSERMSRLQAVGSLMAALGACVVVMNGQFVLHLSPIGDALAFGACLCWAVYSVLMIPASRSYGSLFITRKVFFYGVLTIIPYYFFYPGFPPLSLLLRADILAGLLFLGVIASLLCFLAWNWVIKRLGSVTATNYVYLNPVCTIIFARLVLSERITPWFLVGTMLIIPGMYMCARRK